MNSFMSKLSKSGFKDEKEVISSNNKKPVQSFKSDIKQDKVKDLKTSSKGD